jgi:hypothetical protein
LYIQAFALQALNKRSRVKRSVPSSGIDYKEIKKLDGVGERKNKVKHYLTYEHILAVLLEDYLRKDMEKKVLLIFYWCKYLNNCIMFFLLKDPSNKSSFSYQDVFDDEENRDRRIFKSFFSLFSNEESVLLFETLFLYCVYL